jgi:hypothetical protein
MPWLQPRRSADLGPRRMPPVRDLVPPVASGRLPIAWNHFDSGAGGPGYAIVRLPYLEAASLDKLELGRCLSAAVADPSLRRANRGSSHSPAVSSARHPAARWHPATFALPRCGVRSRPAQRDVATGLHRRPRAATRQSGRAHPLVFAFKIPLLGFVFVSMPLPPVFPYPAASARARLRCSRRVQAALDASSPSQRRCTIQPLVRHYSLTWQAVSDHSRPRRAQWSWTRRGASRHPRAELLVGVKSSSAFGAARARAFALLQYTLVAGAALGLCWHGEEAACRARPR